MSDNLEINHNLVLCMIARELKDSEIQAVIKANPEDYEEGNEPANLADEGIMFSAFISIYQAGMSKRTYKRAMQKLKKFKKRA